MTLRDELAAAFARIDTAREEATAAMRDVRIIQAQMRDAQLTQPEWIVYLQGLSDWEQEHGRGIFA